MREIVQFALIVIWLVGIVLANGFTSTFFAILLPPWGWYLVVERILKLGGWV